MTKQQIRLTLALVVGFLFGGLICILAFVPIPAENREVLQVTAGSLGGAFLMVLAFYFGDSEGK